MIEPKKETLNSVIKRIENCSITSRENLLSELKKILGDRVIKIINTHNTNPIIFFFLLNSKRYVLKV